MAVYAGMLDNADQQVGRLREHLRAIGELDNTVFVIMSDNGADFTDTSRINLPFRAWYRWAYPAGEGGGPGSYVHYGPYWAEVSNTPLSLIKGSPSEGGMRVPFILSLPPALKGPIQDGAIVDGFAWGTDILPTLLDIGGITLPGDEYRGRKLHRPTGKSLLPYLRGEAARVHATDEPIGFESRGAQALYQGDWQVMRMGSPFDGKWRLYNLREDPTESRDLSAAMPERAHAGRGRAYPSQRRECAEPGYDPAKKLLRATGRCCCSSCGGCRRPCWAWCCCWAGPRGAPGVGAGAHRPSGSGPVSPSVLAVSREALRFPRPGFPVDIGGLLPAQL